MVRDESALSPQQRKLYFLLRDSVYASGSMPTLREICSQMGWKAVGTAQQAVEALIAKGWIARDAQKARGLRLTDTESFRMAPVLGSAPAGSPIEAIEHHDGDAIVPSFIRGPVFAVRVRGDSMRDVGIENDDLVIVRQTPHARTDDIVVAVVQGEVTIKRLVHRDEEIWLYPENSKYKPRQITDPSFRILGKVVGLHRYWE